MCIIIFIFKDLIERPVLPSCFFKCDEVVRVGSSITEHHKNEGIGQVVHGTVMQACSHVVGVQWVRFLHGTSRLAGRAGQNSGPVHVLQTRMRV